MKILAATLLISLCGCEATHGRPDQDNFTVRASEAQADRLLQRLSKEFGAVQTRTIVGLGNDPSRIFRFDGLNAMVVVNQMPDDRCNSNAPMHSTFRGGDYRIDLVYRSKSGSDRSAAKAALIHSAHDEGLRISNFKEC